MYLSADYYLKYKYATVWLAIIDNSPTASGHV
jgi:hypothetical protein